MKLSEVRKCDACSGVLAPQGMFYVIRVSVAMVSPRAAQQTLGLTQILDGHLGLAEVMSPDPEVIKILGDEDAKLMTELLICQDCYLLGPLDLVCMVETRNDVKRDDG